MSLPSQTARPIARRSHMYRRRRRNRKIVLVAGLTALIAGGAWLVWPDGEGVRDAAGGPGLDALHARLDADGANSDQADSAAQRPAVETPAQHDARQTAAHGERGRSNRASDRPAQPPMASVTSTLVMGEPIEDGAVRDPQPAARGAIDPSEHQPDESGRASAPSMPTPVDTTDRTADTTAQRLVQQGTALLERRPVEARLLLSQALRTGELTPAEMRDVRRTLTTLNEALVFSPQIVPDDPYALQYTVESGDRLQKIVRRMALQVHWRFISRINNVDPRRIRPGQTLKLITGPFHAVVDKSAFRMDVYLGDGPQQVYVCSMPVGLGQYNSTPEGLFRVRPKSKAINPAWVNPRTGEQFDANDPDNPIGDHWIGLEGVDPALKDVLGYGIHGTIEPESIGEEASMGCIRLGDADVALVYEVLVEEASLVRIVP